MPSFKAETCRIVVRKYRTASVVNAVRVDVSSSELQSERSIKVSHGNVT